MIRHEQAADDLTVDNMAFHNLRHVGLRLHAVPDALGVDHHAGPLRAMVQTAGFVRTNDILQIQALGFRLEPSVQSFRSQFRTTAPRIVRAALVDTDENMALERRQMDPVCYACKVVVWKRPISWFTSGTARNGDWLLDEPRIAAISRSRMAAR